MKFPLKRHSANNIHDDISILADLRLHDEDKLWINYQLTGAIHTIKIPDISYSYEPEFKDELWKTSCFEIFLKHADLNSYYELNFSPSRNWAAYHFENYRESMNPLKIQQPLIEWSKTGLAMDFAVLLNIQDYPAILSENSMNVGISVILEDENGIKSFWALNHPNGAADFHHKDCFLSLAKANI